MQRIALFVLLAFFCTSFTQGHGQHSKERRTPERGIASFMELFANLERQCATAIQKQDKAALDQLLASEFIFRNANDADHVMQRSDWLDVALPTYKLGSFNQSGVAVRVFPGDIALVSFVQSQEAEVGNKKESGKFLVVDVWIANREIRQWQLAQRYWAPSCERGGRNR
jgi:hypothetical protein